MTEKYTDRDRQKIANKEYSAYKFGDEVNIGTLEHPRYIGTVREVLKDATGLDGYVIEEPDGNECCDGDGNTVSAASMLYYEVRKHLT
ncbi:TPA: hypothetical protein U2C66_000391 [Streptococcus suis]|nr:hypothetical protein [Streptococcus suis]HEM6173120.1 hypothetical protein [Streptococcus suis]HEM6256733.1 hypothetical protein [Streptococcus suis]